MMAVDEPPPTCSISHNNRLLSNNVTNTSSPAGKPTSKDARSITITTTTSTITSPEEQSTTQPPFPYTFTQIIEADHNRLTRLALQLLNPNPTLTLPKRISLLTTLLARLIRHDISEELVMRPAFVRYMAVSGAKAAEHDRKDHARLKRELVGVYARAVEMVKLGGGTGGGDGEKWLTREIGGLVKEMAEHMKVESGVEVPRFEACVGKEISLALGCEYARTLLLGVDVYVPVFGTGSERGESGMTMGKVRMEKCFGGLMEYVDAGVDQSREVLRRLQEGAYARVDGGYFERRVKEEMRELGLPLDEGRVIVVRKRGGKL